jgi:uncharacterized damage-inducible protein DinB
MQELERYEADARPPAEPTLREAVRYLFDEIQRRAYQSTKGLTPEQVNHQPGHGAMSIGAILTHQLRLIGFITNNLKPGAVDRSPDGAFGSEGNWDFEAILAHRERINEIFRQVWAEVDDATLMTTRPEMPLPAWADWPVLMRFLRPLTDTATHIGQVNYLRRQLGNPVGKY